MALCFLLLVVIVQCAFLVVARHTAGAAADAAARAAARSGGSAVTEQAELLARVIAAVPGAVDPEVAVTVDGSAATARVTFRWSPPGPDMIPVEVMVQGSASLLVPP